MAFSLPAVPVTNTVIAVSWGVDTRDSLAALDQHQHTGSTGDGAVIAHANLGSVTADQHHSEDHASRHEPGGADEMAVDAAAATGSLRTIGSGALQGAAGNHTHTLTAEQVQAEQSGVDLFNSGDENSYTALPTTVGSGEQLSEVFTPNDANSLICMAAHSYVKNFSADVGSTVGQAQMRLYAGSTQEGFTTKNLQDTAQTTGSIYNKGPLVSSITFDGYSASTDFHVDLVETAAGTNDCRVHDSSYYLAVFEVSGPP